MCFLFGLFGVFGSTKSVCKIPQADLVDWWSRCCSQSSRAIKRKIFSKAEEHYAKNGAGYVIIIINVLLCYCYVFLDDSHTLMIMIMMMMMMMKNRRNTIRIGTRDRWFRPWWLDKWCAPSAPSTRGYKKRRIAENVGRAQWIFISLHEGNRDNVDCLGKKGHLHGGNPAFTSWGW